MNIKYDPNKSLFAPKEKLEIKESFSKENIATIFHGDCLKYLNNVPNNSFQLIVTSPPYNLGKEYEKKLDIEEYVSQQRKVINECIRVTKEEGSICWEVGNYVEKGEIIPLDILLYNCFKGNGLKLRNRVIWHFGHGLHCSKRFSGSYETILWFTKSENYVFNLDPVRVPQKYPGKKHFKGPNVGKYSSNPVDWFPWCDEAFEKAEKGDKPIFLSIGYSTCHWCHVMERDSFQDSEVAKLLNETFVCIKVDREERPDIDDVYMTVCQMLTGSGGWPLTILMTHDKKPFYAATYVPKKSRYDMLGMLELVPRIKDVWESKTEDEIREVLSPEETEFALQIFNIKSEGNFFDPATNKKLVKIFCTSQMPQVPLVNGNMRR